MNNRLKKDQLAKKKKSTWRSFSHLYVSNKQLIHRDDYNCCQNYQLVDKIDWLNDIRFN